MTTEAKAPSAFVWRRLHSLMGLWLTIFIIQHLLVNSQAALLIGDDGAGFIRGVNAIHELPYLPFIEITILAIPIFIHMWWGIKYILTGKYNSFGNTGHDPYLPQYPRNHAYTWQRLTAWILAIGIIAHVAHMRFLEYPPSAQKGSQEYFMMRVGLDDGIYTVAERLGVKLVVLPRSGGLVAEDKQWVDSFVATLDGGSQYTPQGLEKEEVRAAFQAQKERQNQEWFEAFNNWKLKPGEALALAKDFGTAELFLLRETFKIPAMLVLYTLLVLAACFHGFNGLWTFLIKWGVTLTERSQMIFMRISWGLMLGVAFLGLSAVWLTYWINLRH